MPNVNQDVCHLYKRKKMSHIQVLAFYQTFYQVLALLWFFLLFIASNQKNAKKFFTSAKNFFTCRGKKDVDKDDLDVKRKSRCAKDIERELSIKERRIRLTKVDDFIDQCTDIANKELDRSPDIRPEQAPTSKIFMITFKGDTEATGADKLTDQIEFLIKLAKPGDVVLLDLDSGGGYVSSYGYLYAELMRLKQHGIDLHVFVGQVAASGGYLLAVTGNKIISSPFAAIGSIGVIVEQLNFNKLLRKVGVEVEQHTAGDNKRNITTYGVNTDEKREKLNKSLKETHEAFQEMILKNRPGIDIKKVSTGQCWFGQECIDLNLVDQISSLGCYLEQLKKERPREIIRVGAEFPTVNSLVNLDKGMLKNFLEELKQAFQGRTPFVI